MMIMIAVAAVTVAVKMIKFVRMIVIVRRRHVLLEINHNKNQAVN